jgi:hypothetical protein
MARNKKQIEKLHSYIPHCALIFVILYEIFNLVLNEVQKFCSEKKKRVECVDLKLMVLKLIELRIFQQKIKANKN